MTTRNLAGAFLTYKDQVLLMHRGLHKKLGPGMWSGVGGFIEPEEIDSPLIACCREIQEETGITPDDISDLTLKYITMQNADGVLELIYYFIGDLKHECQLTECDEGSLHWVDKRDAQALPMSLPIKLIFMRWLRSPENDRIELCVIGGDNNAQWNVL